MDKLSPFQQVVGSIFILLIIFYFSYNHKAKERLHALYKKIERSTRTSLSFDRRITQVRLSFGLVILRALLFPIVVIYLVSNNIKYWPLIALILFLYIFFVAYYRKPLHEFTLKKWILTPVIELFIIFNFLRITIPSKSPVFWYLLLPIFTFALYAPKEKRFNTYTASLITLYIFIFFSENIYNAPLFLADRIISFLLLSFLAGIIGVLLTSHEELYQVYDMKINKIKETMETPEQLAIDDNFEALKEGLTLPIFRDHILDNMGLSLNDIMKSSTESEKKVLIALQDGSGDKDIAKKLMIDEDTVKSHFYNFRSKIKENHGLESLSRIQLLLIGTILDLELENGDRSISSQL